MYFIQIKHFCSSKDTVKTKKQDIYYEKHLQNISDNRHIHKEPLESSKKKKLIKKTKWEKQTFHQRADIDSK